MSHIARIRLGWWLPAAAALLLAGCGTGKSPPRAASQPQPTPSPVVQSAAANDVAEAIRERIATLDARGALFVQGLGIASRQLLTEFYAARDYQPVWTDPQRVEELLELLAGAADHGLDPADYYLEPLRTLGAAAGPDADAAMLAELDVLRTESLIRYGYHQRFGKVNPERIEPTWNFTREFRPGLDPLRVLNEAVAAPVLEDFLDRWIQRLPLYQDLQQALAAYRAIEAAGGWPAVPDGPKLEPGMRDPRVPVLRERLRITGDLAAAEPDDATLYTGDVVEGVRTFQARHGLDPDGVIGPRTLTALNVPVRARIDQLRLTLERSRWVLDDTAGDFIVVNIAGFEVFVVREGQIVSRRRAVVGRTVRETPIFKGEMTYIELNPTWTIPPTILREDVLPKVRRDPGYLAANHITVLDRQGRVVDPQTVDWSMSARAFPYTLRQEPGPDNALGRIKFMFPNRHAVFLHDTPARELFERAERLFSSGCIRVEDPLSLAEIVLREPEVWNRETLAAAIGTGKTRRIPLRQSWPVLVMYWTAELDAQKRVRFLRDVYDRDAQLLAALNGPVRIDFPATTAETADAGG